MPRSGDDRHGSHGFEQRGTRPADRANSPALPSRGSQTGENVAPAVSPADSRRPDERGGTQPPQDELGGRSRVFPSPPREVSAVSLITFARGLAGQRVRAPFPS